MFHDDLPGTARALVRRRGRVLGDKLNELARAHSNTSAPDLVNQLSRASRDEKSAVGLLLARVVLEDALTENSREKLNSFLFRFGAHLKTSVSDVGVAPGERRALAMAAEKVFNVLPTASTGQQSEVSNMLDRLSGRGPSEQDWHSSLGLSQPEFFSAIDQIAGELGGVTRPARPPTTRPKTKRIANAVAPAVRKAPPADPFRLGSFSTSGFA